MHPFRFAVRTTWARTPERWAERARRAEALGYDTLLMPDHLAPQFAPIPALAAAAAATTRLRVGVHVFDNDFRNPVLLATEVGTLDQLSNGRVELGIGAGWRVSDYHQLGIAYDPPKVRIDRMVEAIRLLKRLFTEERVDFAGTHYRVRGARLEVRPVQRPHPPLVIGGGGPRMMRIAAREADVVSFNPQMTARGRPRVGEVTTNATAKKVASLRKAAGARFDAIELSGWVAHVNVSDGRPALAAAGAGLERLATGLIGTPYVLAGSRARIREDLLRWREDLGFSYWTIPANWMEEFAPVVAQLAGR